MWTRRAALQAIGGAGAAALAPARALACPDPLSGAVLYEDLRAYVAFGPKRTGTAEDHAVSAWLEAQAAATGARVTRQTFRVRQFFLDRASFRVGEADIPCFPFWFPRAASVAGVLRPLAQAGAGEVAYVETPPGTEGLRALPDFVAEAATRRAAGLVALTPTPSGELFGHGRPETVAVPTLLVGGGDRARLEAALAAGAEARIDIAGREEPDAPAYNILARFEGAGPLAVITTPSSAWFASGGERGPGVALWLALLRWAALRTPRPNLLFAALSGHELRAAGAQAFVRDGAPEPAAVRLWAHLGASIATYDFERDTEGAFRSTGRAGRDARLLANDSAIAAVLARRFAKTTPFTPEITTGEGARGELQLYFGRGYRGFGFEGTHDWFHAPGDLAASSGPELLEPVARALVGVLQDLEIVA